MAALAFVIIVVTAIAAGVYLVVSGHPWFALLMFLIPLGSSYRRGPDRCPRCGAKLEEEEARKD